MLRRILAPVTVLALAGGLVAAPTAAADEHADLGGLDWGECPTAAMTAPGTVCADVQVPRDHADPGGAEITLTVSRVPATGERRGVIAGNPGGPGGDALGMFSDEAVRMPDAVREHFDLIAVEPRGLSWGTPLKCNVAGIPTSGIIAGQVGAMYTACESNDPGYAATITTENTARDLEHVRGVLGQDELHLYGLSYGTDLMGTYATLFPGSTGRVVLDSSVDPAHRYFQLGDAREQWRRDALNAMFQWIADHDEQYGLGTTPLQAYTRWSQRINEEVGAPGQVYPPPTQVGDVPAVFADNPKAVNELADAILPAVWRGHSFAASMLRPGAGAQSVLLQMTFAATYSESMWPQIADAIVTGDVPVPPTPEGVTPEDAVAQLEAMTTVERAIVCNDNVSDADPTRIPRAYVDQYTGGDIFRVNADALASGQLCLGWPGHRAAVDLDGAALKTPPLLLHYDKDAAVTGTGGRAMQAAMGGELIELPGYSHGVLVGNNDPDQVADAVSAHYLG
ncbi:alpha/beta fold hydrolase [Corynebacterium sp. NPDC060344]|uniref:alpha/beta fold hydrolase n=1 Tax=Corynebacterium sp. NPDC060344 TaxID=3347101 RepID=UPI0036514A4E